MPEAKPKIGLMDIDAMRDDPRNARTHDSEQLEMLAGLVVRFGFTNPLLIDVGAENLIVAGHGRKASVRLLRDRGTEIRLPDGRPLPAGKLPFIDVTGWDEEKRRAYALADNQSALRAGWDPELLASELDGLADIGIDAASLGFEDGWLESLTEDALGTGDAGGGELTDSTFVHADQYGVIVTCADATDQEATFNRLRDELGADRVKVVVV
jgi:ParB-like chromosome segregation protein Spo0J